MSVLLIFEVGKLVISSSFSTSQSCGISPMSVCLKLVSFFPIALDVKAQFT